MPLTVSHAVTADALLHGIASQPSLCSTIFVHASTDINNNMLPVQPSELFGSGPGGVADLPVYRHTCMCHQKSDGSALHACYRILDQNPVTV